ncbi:MAG: TrmH family RNA methyltransferase [Phycisphaerales bacterium JB061]
MNTTTNIIPLEEPVSPDDDRLIEYRQLRENRLSRPLPGAPDGVFIAEGDKVVRLMIEEGRFAVRSLLISQSRRAVAEELAALRPASVPVYLAGQELMDEIVGFPIHRGVLASGVRLPDPPIQALLGKASGCIVLEGLSNHDNVGGVMRVAAALGGVNGSGVPACPVLLDPTSCDPLYRKSIRVSMGHALGVPYSRIADWPAGLGVLGGLGFTTVALSTAADSVGLGELGEIKKPALMLGAEGPGLSESASLSADVRVRIPMSPGVDSLNVVTAAAIALAGMRLPGLE